MLPAIRVSSTSSQRVGSRLQPRLSTMLTSIPVRDMLFAFGDDKYPLDETVRILDEITTDFVIETSHIASKAAEYSGRTKLKIDDFKFAIRGDEILTGRVRELLAIDKELKESRKQFDTGEGRVGLERGGRRKKEDKVEGKEEAKANSKPSQDEGLGEEDDE